MLVVSNAKCKTKHEASQMYIIGYFILMEMDRNLSWIQSVCSSPWRSSFFSTHDLAKQGQMNYYVIILTDSNIMLHK